MPPKRLLLIILFLIFALVLAGCGASAKNDDDSAAPADDDAHDSLRPVVFVHGVLEFGDAFSNQAMRYGSNGYCLNRIYTYDYNSLIGPNGANVTGLETFVDHALVETGAAQVDLLGHSLGGAVCQEYLKTPANAAKVAHYANLASFDVSGGQPLPVPALNISSTADHIAGPSTLTGAQNVTFDDLDHLQVATSAETFATFFNFFYGEPPTTTDIVPAEPIVLSGRVLVFALNQPATNHVVQIYEVSPETGERQTADPLAEFTTDENGGWGDFTATPGAYYEFAIIDASGEWPPVHYYREPFQRANNKVYFRSLPPRRSLLGFVFSLLPYNDDYAIFAWLEINQAFVYGRDTMTVDGLDITSPAMADPSITTIAIFFFDTNFNGVSDQKPSGGLYNKFIFMRFFDLLIPSTPARGVPFVFDGRPITIRNWPSKTGGLSITVFE